MILEKQDRFEEAAELFVAILAETEQRGLGKHWLAGVFHKGYGVTLTRRGDFGAAEPELLQAVQALAAKFGDQHTRTQRALQATVDLYEAWDQPQKAEPFRARVSR